MIPGIERFRHDRWAAAVGTTVAIQAVLLGAVVAWIAVTVFPQMRYPELVFPLFVMTCGVILVTLFAVSLFLLGLRCATRPSAPALRSCVLAQPLAALPVFAYSMATGQEWATIVWLMVAAGVAGAALLGRSGSPF